MLQSSPQSTSSKATATRSSASAACAVYRCATPAACRAARACRAAAAAGAARALTAPTLTATATVLPKGCCGFPAAPTRSRQTSTTRTSCVTHDTAATTLVSGTYLVPRNPNAAALAVSATASGVFFPAAGNLQLTSPYALTAPAGDSDSGSLRALLSRRGLSVHATPFRPQSSTDAWAILSTSEMPELSDPLSLREGQQRNCSSDSNAAALQSKGIRTPGLEFPRTPLAGEPACVRVSPPAGTSAGVVPVPASSSASFGGGDSIQWSTPLLPISPEFTNHHEQQHHHHQQQQQRSVCCASLGVGTSGISSVLCPPDIRDEGGGDNVRHLRVPFTDAEAMDEAAMLHLLRGSSSSDDDGNDNDDDDEEDAVYMRQQQQPHMFDVATVLPTNLDVYHCAGGYWDLEGPRAATRRFLRRSTPSIASFTLTANGGSSSARVVGNGAATDAGIDSDDDDDLWEMNSSAYADSLDEAQVEWIEQQLHAKENPEGFFF